MRINCVPDVDIVKVSKANGFIELKVMKVNGESKDYYFVKIKDAIIGKEDRVIVNIANEWMGEWNSANWATGYKAAIPIIRNAGFKHTIMVDAGGWGQHGQSVKDAGKQVFDADPQKNVIFSIHMYGTAGKDAATIKNNMDGVINQGLALCIGEFGWNHSDGNVDEATIMSYCQEKKVGWMAWSWKGNSSEVAYLDLSSDWAGNSLTSNWGVPVVNGTNGLKQTSKICSIFTGPSVPPTTVRPTNTPIPTGVIEDINKDGAINMTDIMLIAEAFNTTSSSPKYQSRLDLNKDNSINMTDVMICAAKFNQVAY